MMPAPPWLFQSTVRPEDRWSYTLASHVFRPASQWTTKISTTLIRLHPVLRILAVVLRRFDRTLQDAEETLDIRCVGDSPSAQ